jgi:nicotinamide-nucleotide amidase
MRIGDAFLPQARPSPDFHLPDFRRVVWVHVPPVVDGLSVVSYRTEQMSTPPKGASKQKAATKVAPSPAAKEPATKAIRRINPLNTAGLLAIGDEVVSGEVANANAAFLSARLSEAGLSVREHLVVTDDPRAIRGALQRLQKEVEVIIVTGGLGPTEDDRTIDVVCELLSVEAVQHTPSLEAMKERFSAHGFELTPNNLRQVRIPKGAEAMMNAAGIAPGFRVTLEQAEAFFLPGVPREMERIYLDHVAPRLEKILEKNGVPPPAIRTWHVYGMGESHIDHRLAGILEGITGASLHFRTAHPENHVKVVVRGPDPAKAKELLERIDSEVRKRIGAGIYGVDEETFPLAVARVLRASGATLALAESCTGGYAGEIITSEPGASDFFLGSIVCYSNDVKVNVLGVKAATIEEHGSVSELCAKEMADGAKRITNASVAVAITGVAGPLREGVSSVTAAGDKPVGTVCFAVAGPKSTKTSSKFFTSGRERIRRAAAFHALELARRQFA